MATVCDRCGQPITASAKLAELKLEVKRLQAGLLELNSAAADLVAEAVGPYDPPQRGSNLEKLYRLVKRP